MNIPEKYYWLISTFMVPVLYIVIAGLFYIVLYKWKPVYFSDRKIQHGNIDTRQLRMEIIFSLISLLIFCAIGFGVYLIYKSGYSQIYFSINKFGWIYFTLSFGLMIFFHDTYFYWTHRLLHTSWWFKNIHQIHHRSFNPTPWAALSFHPAEAFIQAAIMVIIIMLIPVHPAALFIFLLYMVFKNVLGHTGYELTAGVFKNMKWNEWRNSSTDHNNHHLYGRDNYGLYFTFWDKWMKTFHPKK